MSETVDVKEEVEQQIFELMANNGLGLIEAWLLLTDMTDQIHAEISGVVE